MENQTGIDKLNQKVAQIIAEYNGLKEANEALKLEVVSLKAQADEKDKEISRLEDDNVMKDLEMDEIVKKIESIIG